ncbi:diguanylate cyclase [Sulfurimonas sp. SAG-AH-194-L11]|nr:diguanylate cyclase [Sulfurimonas sp. SAG-AH-194-L11]MDF1876375.1 diguanylate cyclase [Sulfurimonas sp. SAG-AH-194-L11]
MQYENITILYVEDETATRKMLGDFISRFCGKLLTAKDGEEALEIYEQNSIDIIISDIKMPKINGIEMVEAIKKLNKEQLVIYTTAHIDSEYLFRAIELQVDGYISKPVDLDKLRFRIEKCINEIESKKTILQLQESEEKFRKISQTAQMGIFIYQKTFVYVNEAFCKMTEYSEEELLNMLPWEMFDKDSVDKIREVSLLRVKGEVFPEIYNDAKLITKSGNVLICRASTNTIEYDGGYAGVGSIVDITDVIETKEQLKLLGQAIEQMDEMVRITDKQGIITYVNKALLKHTKYKKSELIGKSNHLFKSGKHSDSFYKILWETILTKKTFQAIFMNVKKDGELYYEDQTITPILDDNNKIKYFVSTSKDVTEKMKLEEKLTTLATIDALTGIYNRYKINLLIEEEINRVNRYGGAFALFMFDLDFFKNVNDTYGHDVGDYVLQEFTRIIKNSVRDTDKFGRWGGEEFMLLSLDINSVISFAQKLCLRVAEHKFKDIGHITVSIGIALYDKSKSKKQLLKEVDNALYEAKEGGRNMVVLSK